MKSLFVDVLANHDTGVKKHYLRIKESELLQEYLKAADALTIDPTKRLQQKVQQLEGQQTEEIERLKAQLQSNKEELAKAKQYHDTSMLSIQELEARMRATEDRFERSILASQHIQKFMILEREKYNKLPAWEKKNREEWLAWEKIEAAKKPSEKKESFVDYCVRKRKQRKGN